MPSWGLLQEVNRLAVAGEMNSRSVLRIEKDLVLIKFFGLLTESVTITGTNVPNSSVMAWGSAG